MGGIGTQPEPMIERYSSREMQAVWSEENKYRTWLEVEIAICEGMAEYDYIPKDAPAVIRERARFNVDRIAELELETRHDVMAFVRNVAENVGEAGRWIHYGITSYDVVDTALALRLRQSTDLILRECEKLMSVIKRMAYQHKMTPQIGRTHGIHAEPITFGFKLCGWYAEMQRNVERIRFARKQINAGKVSGAVGIHANADPRVEAYVCNKLGLEPDSASTQIISRDRHAHLMSAFAILAGSLERFATEIRNLQRTEILEVQEAFSPGQTGSSAMPHKRNPWNSETVSGLARIVRANTLAMFETISTWHERDLTNSSIERIILPDTCTLIDWMLRKFTTILDGLVIFPERMKNNLELMGELPFSEHVMLALISKGLAREQAYQLVQRNAAKAWAGQAFLDCLLTDPEIRERLSEEEIRQCLDLEHHLRHIEVTYRQVFGADGDEG